jgi:phage shock protein A
MPPAPDQPLIQHLLSQIAQLGVQITLLQFELKQATANATALKTELGKLKDQTAKPSEKPLNELNAKARPETPSPIG